MAKKRIDIGKLKAGFSWYSEYADGSVYVKEAFSLIPSGVRLIILTDATRIAFALNQACCERGMGRFYTLPRAPQEPNKFVTAEESAIFNIRRALPELFYTREPWSQSQQDEWRAMTPVQQLHRMDSRLGWVSDHMPGLSVGVVLGDLQMSRLRINGVTQALVTILITPQPYVGLTERIVQDCTRVYKCSDGGLVQRCMWLSDNAGWEDFSDLKCSGVRGVLDACDALILGPTECQMFYGTVVDAIQKAELKVYQIEAAAMKAAVTDSGQGEGDAGSDDVTDGSTALLGKEHAVEGEDGLQGAGNGGL